MEYLVSVITTIIGCAIGVAGWISGRDKRNNKDGEWRGKVDTKLDLAVGLRTDVDDLYLKYTENSQDIAVLKQDVKSVNRRISKLEGK